MKNLYKSISVFAMALFLFLSASTEVAAGNVNTVGASVSSNKITVSGTAQSEEPKVVACAILAYDQAETTLVAMEICPVDSNGNYSYTLSQSFPAGTYTIKVADYEGGAFQTTTVTLAASANPGGGNTGSSTGSTGGSSGTGGSSESNDTQSTTTTTTTTTTTANEGR